VESRRPVSSHVLVGRNYLFIFQNFKQEISQRSPERKSRDQTGAVNALKEERTMNRIPTVVTILLILGAPARVHAQKLTVVAMSHKTDEFDYTTTTPQTSNTNCNVYGTSVNCNTRRYGGGSRTNAVYRLNQVVTSDEGGKVIKYTLTRTARWRWSSTDWLAEGDTFPAEIKGKHMYITSRKGGNQGKEETLKYDILDIRPVQ
jgi:hypothetical protein